MWLSSFYGKAILGAQHFLCSFHTFKYYNRYLLTWRERRPALTWKRPTSAHGHRVAAAWGPGLQLATASPDGLSVRCAMLYCADHALLHTYMSKVLHISINMRLFLVPAWKLHCVTLPSPYADSVNVPRSKMYTCPWVWGAQLEHPGVTLLHLFW